MRLAYCLVLAACSCVSVACCEAPRRLACCVLFSGTIVSAYLYDKYIKLDDKDNHFHAYGDVSEFKDITYSKLRDALRKQCHTAVALLPFALTKMESLDPPASFTAVLTPDAVHGPTKQSEYFLETQGDDRDI